MKREHQTIAALLLASLMLLAGCTGKDDVNAAKNNPTTSTTVAAQPLETTLADASIPDTTIVESKDPVGPDVRVEVYHFHPNTPCNSCSTMGALAEKTVNTYFVNEVASGKLVFGHVNFQAAQNADLAKKYGVTGSALWIGTYVDGKFYKEENVNVWYKINNEKDYLSYFKGVLEKRLKGDLSE